MAAEVVSKAKSKPDVQSFYFFFFQAEDGIRDRNVTGVQTCASSDLAAPVLPRQPTAGERAERLEANAVLRAERQHLALGVAHEQRVLVLHDRDPAELLAQLVAIRVRQAVLGDEPVRNELVERAERLCNR